MTKYTIKNRTWEFYSSHVIDYRGRIIKTLIFHWSRKAWRISYDLAVAQLIFNNSAVSFSSINSLKAQLVGSFKLKKKLGKKTFIR